MQYNMNPANQGKNSAKHSLAPDPQLEVRPLAVKMEILIMSVGEVEEETGYPVEVIERMLATGEITGAYRYKTGEWAVPLGSLLNSDLSWNGRQGFEETEIEFNIPLPTYKPEGSTQTSQETSQMPPNPVTDGHAKEFS